VDGSRSAQSSPSTTTRTRATTAARLWDAQLPDAAVSCQFVPTVVPYGSATATLAEVLLVLPKIAYLTLCRFIQLLELLAGGDAAKDLELSSYATGSPSSADRPPVPGLSSLVGPCWQSHQSGAVPSPLVVHLLSPQQCVCAGIDA
jgi:hypothetical protein